MHFINLLGENDTEIVILTHQIKSVLIDIILPRLTIRRIVVVGLGASHQFSYHMLRGPALDSHFIISFLCKIFPDEDTAMEKYLQSKTFEFVSIYEYSSIITAYPHR